MVRPGNALASLMRPILVAGLLCLVIGSPPIVSAQIVPGMGIAGVAIGDRAKQVRSELGRPLAMLPPTWVYGAPLRGRVGFDHRKRVNLVWTSSTRQRTARGIGPGVSLRRMKRAYSRATCYPKAGRWRVRCVIATVRRGVEMRADFFFGNLLRRVEIYVVPPVQAPGPARPKAGPE